MRFRLSLCLFFCIVGMAFGDTQSGPFTISSSSSPCATIGTKDKGTVGIYVTGTFSMTLQPKVSLQGQSPGNTQVTPANSSTAQSTITATGYYTANVAGMQQFQLCVSSYVSGSATIYLTASAPLNVTSLNSGGAPGLPIYLNSGTPTSQGNECASITTDTSGNTGVTAVAALRSIDASNVAHDILCVVTADASSPTAIGGVVLPVTTTFSTANASTAASGVLNVSGTGAPRLLMSNTSGTNRANSINWRSCVGGCGTDIQLKEDVAGTGNEDLSWFSGTNINSLYMTFNCPAGCATTFNNNNGAKQFLADDGTHDAKTNPEFALTNGHIGHGTTGSNATDTWGSATCASNTVTVTFAAAFSTTTYKVLLTDQTTKGGANVTTKNAGSMVIGCTGASDVVDYLVLGNPF